MVLLLTLTPLSKSKKAFFLLQISSHDFLFFHGQKEMDSLGPSDNFLNLQR